MLLILYVELFLCTDKHQFKVPLSRSYISNFLLLEMLCIKYGWNMVVVSSLIFNTRRWSWKEEGGFSCSCLGTPGGKNKQYMSTEGHKCKVVLTGLMVVNPVWSVMQSPFKKVDLWTRTPWSLCLEQWILEFTDTTVAPGAHIRKQSTDGWKWCGWGQTVLQVKNQNVGTSHGLGMRQNSVQVEKAAIMFKSCAWV